MSDFETQLLYYASPALLGRKQANLFSFSMDCMSDYRKEIQKYQEEFAPFDISVEYLYCRYDRVYLLIYRKKMLLQYLKNPAVRAFLLKEGYPLEQDTPSTLPQCLCRLRQRILQSKEFPHEIGFFFGYPAEDVFAFIRENGRNYKIVGDWKVYGNQKVALHTFRSYIRCRNRLMKQASAGASIISLLPQPSANAAT